MRQISSKKILCGKLLLQNDCLTDIFLKNLLSLQIRLIVYIMVWLTSNCFIFVLFGWLMSWSPVDSCFTFHFMSYSNFCDSQYIVVSQHAKGEHVANRDKWRNTEKAMQDAKINTWCNVQRRCMMKHIATKTLLSKSDRNFWSQRPFNDWRKRACNAIMVHAVPYQRGTNPPRSSHHLTHVTCLICWLQCLATRIFRMLSLGTGQHQPSFMPRKWAYQQSSSAQSTRSDKLENVVCEHCLMACNGWFPVLTLEYWKAPMLCTSDNVDKRSRNSSDCLFLVLH